MKNKLRLTSILFQAAGLLLVPSALAQLTPGQIAELRGQINDRVEGMTILSGDYGINGADYKFDPRATRVDPTARNVAEITLNKFGGAGDLGDPMPLGNTGVKWQPRFQGSMGYGETETRFYGGEQNLDISRIKTFAIQFGGGARFWFNDHISLAPTIMGMYGHTDEDYVANSDFAKANYIAAQKAGLISWTADTWTIRPGANLGYVHDWHRVRFTFSEDFAYFHTETFESSHDAIKLNGDSETLTHKIDVDIPLGCQLWGRELRTGGYFARTEFFDNIKSGLGTDHMYDFHGRFVLDFLGKLWKVQWLGLGGSYLWGHNFNGYSFGLDVNFRF